MSGKQAKTVVGDLGRLLKTARAGELLVVAELQCLGDSLPDVMAALEKIQERGLVLFEAETGRKFADCYDGPAAGIAADDYFCRRSLSTMKARQSGKKGAEARYKAEHAERAPPNVARQRWNEAVADGATAQDAMRAVNEGYAGYWTYDTFLRWARDGKLGGRVKRLRAGARPKS